MQLPKSNVVSIRTIFRCPPYAGCFVFGELEDCGIGTYMYSHVKPNWFRRVMFKLILGIGWKDI